MKVTTQALPKHKVFTPFTLTITVETEAEAHSLRALQGGMTDAIAHEIATGIILYTQGVTDSSVIDVADAIGKGVRAQIEGDY